MTVIEKIVEAIRALDEPRQRALLAIAMRMRDEPDASLASIDLDDEDDMAAWDERVKAQARSHLGEAMAGLRRLGLVGEDGRIVPRDLPADMRPGSKTSVTT